MMPSEQSTDAKPVPAAAAKKQSAGTFLFQLFCAVIFLGMIGLVFYNAMLRYVFRSSFPPSEEWARFLFMFITFFGGIEAFYAKKHIAVDMLVSALHGKARKAVNVLACLLAMFAMGFLIAGGINCVQQSMDTYSVATHINKGVIYSSLLIMAVAGMAFMIRDLVHILRTPSSEFKEPKAEA